MPDPYQILVVEDNQEQANLVRDFLKMEGLFEIDWAQDIATMWVQLASKSYNAALLDYRLPDGTGLDALAEIRTRGYRLPVIMVTGLGDERVAAQAIQRGAADYLVKRDDYLQHLSPIIQRTIKDYELQCSVEQSMEKIRYQAVLLNSVRDSVIVWDMRGRVTFCNAASEVLFGKHAAAFIGGDVIRDYFPLLSPSPEWARLNLICDREIERQVSCPERPDTWISSMITQLKDPLNELTMGYLDVSRDITERKKADEEHHRMQAQVQAALVQLSQATRLAAIGELASGVAHKIYNPLTTIIAEAQILQRSLAQTPSAVESACDIEKAGWKAQEVVKLLLDFSRPAASTLSVFSPNKTIQVAVTLVGAQIRSEGINLDVDLQEPGSLVFGNMRQLEDLWVNLLLLARDATSDGKAHTVRIHSSAGPDGWIMVEIWDDGKPIEQDVLPKLFEPNFIGTRIGRGTGLEYGICREIVRQHKAHIRALSDMSGNTVQVFFPRVKTQTNTEVKEGIP